MLALTSWVPCAACWTLREISRVAAPCSSMAEAMVEQISDILPMVPPIAPCACSTGFWPCDWIWAECRNGCRPHAGGGGCLVIGSFAREKNSRMRCKRYEKERNDQGRIPFSADRRQDQGTGRLEGQDALPCPRSHQTG